MMIHIIKARDPRKFVVKRLNKAKVGPLEAKIEKIRLKSAFSLEGKITILGQDKPVN